MFGFLTNWFLTEVLYVVYDTHNFSYTSLLTYYVLCLYCNFAYYVDHDTIVHYSCIVLLHVYTVCVRAMLYTPILCVSSLPLVELL